MQASMRVSTASATTRLAAPRQAASRSGRAQVVVRAAIQPPKGVTLPKVLPTAKAPVTGFVDYAERINSRAAMIGFVALMLVEAVSGKGLLELVGVSVGKGLDLGF